MKVRRTPIRRKGGFLKRTPLRRVSKQRAKEMGVYLQKRKWFLATKPRCGVCGLTRPCDIHHIAGRLNGNYLNEATWMAVCRPCHERIHANPSWAREKKYLR